MLGISAFYHDAAAVLVRDGEIIAAAQEERFSRKKHDPRFPQRAINYCLGEGFIEPSELDAVVFYDNPLLTFDRVTKNAVRDAAKAVFSRFREYQPIPEYNSPTTTEWVLLRALLTAWIRRSQAPVLLVLLPHDTALEDEGSPRRSDPRQYQSRFRELAEETGCHVYDPLPALLETNKEVLSGFTAHGHLSVQGHGTMAKLLVPVLQKLTARRIAISTTGAA